MNCAPSFDMVRKSLSPFLSINVTSLRSTVHFLLLSVRRVFFQLLLSSPTHKPTKRPCRIHFSSVGVSVLVIFNTSTSFVWRIDSFAPPTTAAPCSALFAAPRETTSLVARTPFLVGASAPSACGLPYRRVRRRPRPWRLSSARCHARGRRRGFQDSGDWEPHSGQILVRGPSRQGILPFPIHSGKEPEPTYGHPYGCREQLHCLGLPQVRVQRRVRLRESNAVPRSVASIGPVSVERLLFYFASRPQFGRKEQG